MKVKTKVWLDKDGELVFGGSKARILKQILETGSIVNATRELNIS